MLDFITVTVDPRDESAWTGSYGGGLLHIKADNSFEIFKQNSPIKPHPLIRQVIVLLVLFDNENNLWISNFGHRTIGC